MANCFGCGALLTAPVCRYCLRPATPEQVRCIRPDPKDDPRRTVEPRKVDQ
jgi:hypothetical protein